MQIAIADRGHYASTMNFARLASRFSLLFCLVSVLAMCVFWLIGSYHTRMVLQEQADQFGGTITRQAADLIAEHVQADDQISINVILEELVANPAVTEAVLLDEEGRRVAAAGAANAESTLSPLTGPLFGDGYYSRAVEFLGTTHGTVGVRLDSGRLQATLNRNLALLAAAALVMAAATWLLTSAWFRVSLEYPLNMLSYGLGKMRRGEIVECPDPPGRGELSNLTRQYNATARFLGQHTFLDRFGEDAPAVDGAARPGAEISLLVIRMSNYFSLATAMSRDHALGVLERYYFFAGQIGRIYNGRVRYCHEDEILIAFEGPAQPAERAYHAICAGQLFLRLIEHLNKQADGIRTNAGFCLAAHSGGAPAMLYSPLTGARDNLFGETPDQARRICTECPGNSLLLSADCHALAGGDAQVAAEPHAADSTGIETLLALEPPAELGELLDSQAARLAVAYPTDKR